MAQFDEHEVKARLEASRRAKPRFRDSDTYLSILLGAAGLFALISLVLVLAVIFI